MTRESLLRDAGWETSVLLQGLSVLRYNKQMNIISSKFNVKLLFEYFTIGNKFLI